MPTEQHVHLERRGRRQTLHIPREFELTSDEAILRMEGDRLIIEPVRKASLLAELATMQPIGTSFPDVDDGLPPLDEIVL